MKLPLLTKNNKRNKITSRKSDDDDMSKHCDAIIIYNIFGLFGAILKTNSGRICI